MILYCNAVTYFYERNLMEELTKESCGLLLLITEEIVVGIKYWATAVSGLLN